MDERVKKVNEVVEGYSEFGQARAMKAAKQLAENPDDFAWLEWIKKMALIDDAERQG